MTRIAMALFAAMFTAAMEPAQACSFGLHLATHHMGNSYEDAPRPPEHPQWRDLVNSFQVYMVIAEGPPAAPPVQRTKKHLRSVNPGAWANCSGYTAGTYLNSESRPTVYAGYTVSVGPVDITTAVATGYGKPQPIAVPSIGLPGGLRVAAFPAQHHRAGGIHLMWEF